MNRSIQLRAVGIVLSSGGILGCLYVLARALSRNTDPFAIGAGFVLFLVAIAILHDSGLKTTTIAISVSVMTALIGICLLVLWLSIRSWAGPTW